MARITIALLTFLLIALPSTVEAKRVALVIGNSAYVNAGTLANPKNDATDVAAALTKSGFEVIAAFDLNKASLDRKIRDFAGALSSAEAGVFFYAGHGLQIAGRNYLVPVDAELATAESIEFEMVQLEVIQRIMERQTSTNILFLDACRNNPLARNLARAMGSRSAEIARGLAPVESGVGTLISFSTQPGNVASDGSGRNSPFAGALVQRLTSSNDDLSAILIDVRNDVRKQTENKQVPWEHSALTGRFYFREAPAPSPSIPASQPNRSELERAWAFIKETEDQARLEAFIKQFGDTAYAPMARERLEELKKKQVVIAPLSPAAQPEAASRPTYASQFDGTWRIVYSHNSHCTASTRSEGQWTITGGVVINPSRDRGTVSSVGELQFRWRTNRDPNLIYSVRAKLNGPHGTGSFQIEGSRCNGTVSLTRM